MNVLQAMDDPTMFGPHFQGESWDAWRAFLAALHGLPMTETQFATYQHHTGRQDVPAQAFGEAACAVGRRGGKSRVLALLGTVLATQRDYRSYLAPGEIATVAILSVDKRSARTIFRYVKGMLDAVPALKREITKETDEVIELGAQRVAIEITTASFRATRGYTYIAVLADEVAFWRSDESANPDEEILAAIRPGLATIPGSMLLLASSPYSKRGSLYKAYRRHYGENNARVLFWKASTAEMNPRIDPAIIAEAYEDDPISAASEYGGEFRNDIAAFVAREVVEACVEPGCFERPPAGHTYFGFTDPSGGSSDSFTLAIAHRDTVAGKAVLDCIREIKAPFSPDEATREMAETLVRYGLRSVTGDRYAGEWPRERFRVHGIAYELSDKPKSDLYREALPMLNAGTVELLDHPVLITQLCNLERRTARGGRDSIDHPPGTGPGSRDDAANAVAGVIRMVDVTQDDDWIWGRVAGLSDEEIARDRGIRAARMGAL